MSLCSAGSTSAIIITIDDENIHSAEQLTTCNIVDSSHLHQVVIFTAALREVVLSDFQIFIFEIAQVQGENPAIIQLGQKRRLSKAEKKKLKSKHD